MQRKGREAKMVESIQTDKGMLYKGSTVTVVDVVCKCKAGKKNIKIEDATGRIFWVSNKNILFL